MTHRTRRRSLLLRVAAALRRAAAALARRAIGTSRGADDAASSAPPPSGEGDVDFLSQVQETLLRLPARPALPEPGPRRALEAGAGPRGWLRRLRALLEPVRRHEDAVLALALLAGITVMILHWVR